MAVFGLRHPKVGDPVVWYPDGNTEMPGTPGVVVLAGQNAIDICCHTEHGAHSLKQCVWHVNDRRLKENENVKRAGGWDYAPFFQDIFELQALLNQIRRNQENNAKRRQARKGEQDVEVDEVETVASGADE